MRIFSYEISTRHLVAGFAVVAIALPMLSGGFAAEKTSNLVAIQTKDMRALKLRDRSFFNIAIEKYEDQLNAGKQGLVKPEPNDPTTWTPYLAKDEMSSSAKVAVSAKKESELTPAEREKLRIYEKAGYCPLNLPAGFYELCALLVGARLKMAAPAGFMSDRAKNASNTSAASLKQRLDELEKAHKAAAEKRKK